MTSQNNWTREETLLAFYVYSQIPFKESGQSHPLIIEYARIIGRTPAAVVQDLSRKALMFNEQYLVKALANVSFRAFRRRDIGYHVSHCRKQRISETNTHW